MTKNDKNYESVGNIRIKQQKKKKKKKSDTSIGTKILVWFMFITMVVSFIAPLVITLIQAIG